MLELVGCPQLVEPMAFTSAILTAAGESTRMGKPKALLPWHGTTLIEYQVTCLVEGGVAEVVVVLGYQVDTIAPYVKGRDVRYVVNSDFRLGKTTSIKAGVAGIDPRADSILLLAVDQPRRSDIISTVIGAHVRSNAVITSPRFRGHGGHPLVFSASLKSELERISEAMQGIREVFRAHRDEVTEVELDDPIVRLDINTPEAYEKAKRRFEA